MRVFCNQSLLIVLFSLFVLPGLSQPKPTFFKFTENTGNNATVVVNTSATITTNGQPLEAGDEIGVFTPDSLCVGAVVWQNESTAITVWGNNEQTGETGDTQGGVTDGILPGEHIHFRIWKRGVRTEYVQTDVNLSIVFPAHGNVNYSANDIYRLDTLQADLIVNVSPRNEARYIPEVFTLFQNYPNPFNPQTTIGYTVPVESAVRISIYSLLGQRIGEIVNSNHVPGKYEVIFNADGIPSGIYLYRLEAGGFTETKKFILLE
jgi:hypothetical protein